MLSNNKNQGGVALLIFIILVALAAITYYFSTISSTELQIDQKQKTAQVLKQAKAALIAYALTNSYKAGYTGELGKLPCPDYNGAAGEGVQGGSCGTTYANAIGLFPWKSVGTNVLKDNSGTCLLYAVSPAYKTSLPAALNPDSYGQFKIVDSADNAILGSSPEDRPVAIIFAPGGALPGQVRNYDYSSSPFCGGDYTISSYLDNNGVIDNAAINTVVDNVIDKFTQAAPAINDRLITISYDDIWTPLLAALNRNNFFAINGTMYKITEALSMCVAAYGNHNGNHLPMPAALDLNGGEYRRDVDYDDSGNFNTSYAGRLPYDTSRANAVLTGAHAPYLLDNTYCDHLNLDSTAVNDDIIWSVSSGEFRQLWSNWKDHFFYAVSKAYSPAGSLNCSAGCVSVGGVDYAGIVFFSGLKMGAQKRYSPPFDADDKANISNYLEEGRDTQFPDNVGAGIYPSVTSASNDIMFCIKTDMSGVVPCP